eukprot:gene6796-30764_t
MAMSPHGGGLPVLEVGDKVLAQSAAIERYCAKLSNLLPQGDDFEVAQADSLLGLAGDILDQLFTTFKIESEEEKIKARQALLAGGKFRDKLTVLASLVDKFVGGYACGGKLSYVDIHLFVWLCVLSSGTIDGFPTNCLDEYPALQKYRYRIANIPAILAFYKDVTEGGRLAMKPAAVASFA